jgi:hypothetical protein
MQNLTKVTWKMTLRLMSTCLRPPPLPGFCFGVGKQFVWFWIWSRAVCIQYVLQYSTLSLTHPNTPRTHTHCTVYLYLGGVGLETMPLTTSWSKFQDTIMNGLVSSFLYGLCIVQCTYTRKHNPQRLTDLARMSNLDLLNQWVCNRVHW